MPALFVPVVITMPLALALAALQEWHDTHETNHSEAPVTKMMKVGKILAGNATACHATSCQLAENAQLMSCALGGNDRWGHAIKGENELLVACNSDDACNGRQHA